MHRLLFCERNRVRALQRHFHNRRVLNSPYAQLKHVIARTKALHRGKTTAASVTTYVELMHVMALQAHTHTHTCHDFSIRVSSNSALAASMSHNRVIRYLKITQLVKAAYLCFGTSLSVRWCLRLREPCQKCCAMASQQHKLRSPEPESIANVSTSLPHPFLSLYFPDKHMHTTR